MATCTELQHFKHVITQCELELTENTKWSHVTYRGSNEQLLLRLQQTKSPEFGRESYDVKLCFKSEDDNGVSCETFRKMPYEVALNILKSCPKDLK